MWALVQNNAAIYVWPDKPVLHPDAVLVEAEHVEEGWILTDGVFAVPPPAPPPTPAELVDYAATVRFAKETGGVVINGVPIASDRNNQSMVANAVALLANDPTISQIDFKGGGGWVTIARADMLAIGIALGRHVQACFSAERVIDAAIAALTVTTFAEIDAAAWPSNS